MLRNMGLQGKQNNLHSIAIRGFGNNSPKHLQENIVVSLDVKLYVCLFSVSITQFR